jgi:hypothetical protein
VAGDVGAEILPGVACVARGDVFRGAGGHDMAAGVAAFGAEIDDSIRGLDDLDDFEIVLDDEPRVAGLDQRIQRFEKLPHIVEMQPRRRLVEDVECAAGGAPRKFFRQFDALRLAARQGRRRPIWM